MFERLRPKRKITRCLLLGAVMALALTVGLGVPMYRRWLAANFLRFILSDTRRALHIVGEFALLTAVWTYFLYAGGKAWAWLYAFFLTLEMLPAIVCRAASGPWEFGCLVLFPAFWTFFGRELSRPAHGAAKFFKALPIVVYGAGVFQYMFYLSYVLRYGRRLGPNTLMTLLGTTVTEARSYLADQFGWWATIAGFCALFVLWELMRRLILHIRPSKRSWLGAAGVLAVLAAALFCRTRASTYSNLFFDFEKGYRQYQTALDSLKAARADPSRRISLLNISKKRSGEVCVVVVGESASRRHMQRWGYKRKNTPWLCSTVSSVQESLVVLENAYSCMVHTESAVPLALSLASNYDPRLLLHAVSKDSVFMFDQIMKSFSLIEILEGAGIETHWISNQEKIGAYNNLISAQTASADYQEYLEDLPLVDRRVGHQDGDLLPLVERILDEAELDENYVIFLHLRGSHWSYKNDAPTGWPWLLPIKRQINDKLENAEKIDAYDRSISYTDWVLRRVSELLLESKFSVTSLLYFSDHGEDVAGVGHNFDAFKPVMAEIPVVLWFSQGYRRRYPRTVQQLRANSRRIFTSDLICELALGINHVEYEGSNPRRQITSPDYGVTAANARFWQGRLLKSVIPELAETTKNE